MFSATKSTEHFSMKQMADFLFHKTKITDCINQK